MTHSLEWQDKDFAFSTCMLAVALGFMFYYFLSKSSGLKGKFTSKFGEEEGQVRWVVFERLLGVVFFGVVPSVIVLVQFQGKFGHSGLSADFDMDSLYWILGLSPIIILLSYLNRKKADNLAMYPQIRKKEWNLQLLLLSAFSWTAYLLAYEFMFRGYLLFVSVAYLGVWPAIALNVAIYALVHVPKGPMEAFGAVPLGILLGIITIQTGTIWVAFVVHVVMALSNEWLSIQAHPEMKLKRR